MQHLEVIYETGAHSVMAVDSTMEDALEAIKEQHRRALAGEPGGPGTDRPAERVARVLVYDKHPSEFNPDQFVAADQLQSRFEEALKAHTEDGVVDLPLLLSDLGETTSPLISGEPHESNYKMAEADELQPADWGAE